MHRPYLNTPHILQLTKQIWTLPLALLVSSTSYGEDQIAAALQSAWRTTKFYQAESADSFVQMLQLVGRYHGQYYLVKANHGDADDWENRRQIIGLNAELAGQWSIIGQIYVGDGLDPIYDGLYEAAVQWQSVDSTQSLAAGRLDFVFAGMERSTSSKRITTLERSLLINQVMPGEVVGVHGTTQVSGLHLHGGIFAGDITDQFSSMDGGIGAVAGVSMDQRWWYNQGRLNVDYLYNDGDTNNNALRPYRHTLAIYHQGQWQSWQLGIDLTLAQGLDSVADVAAITLLPNYDFAHGWLFDSDRVQLNLRYHLALADDETGLRSGRRYEREVIDGRGDRYQSLYTGLSYYLFDHKLKLMTGAEYAHFYNPPAGTKTYQGWTWSGALRLYY